MTAVTNTRTDFKQTPFGSLPHEIIRKIIKHLPDRQSMGALYMSCRSLKDSVTAFKEDVNDFEINTLQFKTREAFNNVFFEAAIWAVHSAYHKEGICEEGKQDKHDKNYHAFEYLMKQNPNDLPSLYPQKYKEQLQSVETKIQQLCTQTIDELADCSTLQEANHRVKHLCQEYFHIIKPLRLINPHLRENIYSPFQAMKHLYNLYKSVTDIDTGIRTKITCEELILKIRNRQNLSDYCIKDSDDAYRETISYVENLVFAKDINESDLEYAAQVVSTIPKSYSRSRADLALVKCWINHRDYEKATAVASEIVVHYFYKQALDLLDQ